MRWMWLFLVWFFLAPTASAQGLAAFLSPGPLAEPHADLDTVTQCPKCHEPGKGVSADRCMQCHETVRDQVRDRVGFHADKGETCQRCHSDHHGRDHRLVQMQSRGPSPSVIVPEGWWPSPWHHRLEQEIATGS